MHLGDEPAILCHQIMDPSFAVWQTVTQIRHRALTTMQQDQCEKLGVSGKEVENMQHVLATQKERTKKVPIRNLDACCKRLAKTAPFSCRG